MDDKKVNKWLQKNVLHKTHEVTQKVNTTFDDEKRIKHRTEKPSTNTSTTA